MECMGSLFLDRDGGMEDLPIARQWLHRALQIKKTARAFTLLGAACKATGDRDAARDAFRNALEVDESYEEAHFNIALLEKDTNPQLAAASLEKAVELDPNYSDAHQQLGILLQKEGKLLEAEYHFRRCLEVDAADYWSLLYLANVLAVQGRQEPEQLAFPSMQVAFRTWRKL
jgi:Flp pilus assembly protein TadD